MQINWIMRQPSELPLAGGGKTMTQGKAAKIKTPCAERQA